MGEDRGDPGRIAGPALASVGPLVRGATLDHVAVAVRTLAAGAELFRDVLGAEFLMGAETPQGFRFAQYAFPGGGSVELVSPTGEGFVSRFLDRRGEGVHHLTLKVQRIEEQVERLRGAGVPLTLVSFEDPGWKEAFIHPSHAHGVLIQLAESRYTREESARHLSGRFPEAVLMGELTGKLNPPTPADRFRTDGRRSRRGPG